MKKTFALDEIDCANCAAKLETALKKLDGVKNATVNFIAQKLTLEADDEAFDSVLRAVIKETKKIEPDCEIIL